MVQLMEVHLVYVVVQGTKRGAIIMVVVVVLFIVLAGRPGRVVMSLTGNALEVVGPLGWLVDVQLVVAYKPNYPSYGVVVGVHNQLAVITGAD